MGVSAETEARTETVRVWVDQDLCTGDGLCVQYAPEVFEFDVDGLAYVKDSAGELRLAPGSRVDVPAHLRLEVVDAARDCPGECIHVLRTTDDVEIAGPDAQPDGAHSASDRAPDQRGDQPGKVL
jgi:ferredoxin